MSDFRTGLKSSLSNALSVNPVSAILGTKPSMSGQVAGVGVMGGGNGCDCDVPAVLGSCRSNPMGRNTLRGGGFMPVVFPLCDGDAVLNPSVPPLLAMPRYAAPGHLARALSAGSSAPIVVSDVKAAGNLTLTLAATSGERQRYCALLLEVGTSNNVAPGRTTLTLAGTDEDGFAITYTGIELKQARASSSQYLIMMVRNFSGLSVPVFGVCQKDFDLIQTAEAFGLTAAAAPNDATSITFAQSPEAIDRNMVGTVTTGVTGTNYTLSTVVPSTEYFDILATVMAELAAR